MATIYTCKHGRYSTNLFPDYCLHPEMVAINSLGFVNMANTARILLETEAEGLIFITFIARKPKRATVM